MRDVITLVLLRDLQEKQLLAKDYIRLCNRMPKQLRPPRYLIEVIPKIIKDRKSMDKIRRTILKDKRYKLIMTISREK
jgi:hypothetical protein